MGSCRIESIRFPPIGASESVDGPLAFDVAISAEAAAIKGLRSPVSGSVDIVLVPDLVSGNILAKDLAYLAGATLAGLVLGAAVPIVLTSRADPPDARLASFTVAALLHHSEQPVDDADATEASLGVDPRPTTLASHDPATEMR